VRHLVGTSWHPATDALRGMEEYYDPEGGSTHTIRYNHLLTSDTEFLFVMGEHADCFGISLRTLDAWLASWGLIYVYLALMWSQALAMAKFSVTFVTR
jgi:hypothetical protein